MNKKNLITIESPDIVTLEVQLWVERDRARNEVYRVALVIPKSDMRVLTSTNRFKSRAEAEYLMQEMKQRTLEGHILRDQTTGKYHAFILMDGLHIMSTRGFDRDLELIERFTYLSLKTMKFR